MRTTRGENRKRRHGAQAALLAAFAAPLCVAQLGPAIGPPAPEEATTAIRDAPSPQTVGDLLRMPEGDAVAASDAAAKQNQSNAGAASTPIRSSEDLPLGAAPSQESRPIPAPDAGGASVTDGWMGRTIAALALVIGLALSIRSIIRRVGRAGGGLQTQLGAGGRAPSGVLLVLGRYPISRGQTLVLLKVDRRILLLCQSAQGFQTLSEISDPEEVASLLIKTRDESGESMTHRFNSLLRRIERDPTVSGEPTTTLPESRLVEIKDDDSWAARERWGETEDGADDPVRMLRRRLESLSGGAS